MKREAKRRWISLGTKALVSYVCLALFVVLLMGSLSYALIHRYIRNVRLADLMTKAERIAESSSTDPSGNWLPKPSTVHTYEKLTDAKVFYLNADTGGIRMSRYDPSYDSRTGEKTHKLEEKKAEEQAANETASPAAKNMPAAGRIAVAQASEAEQLQWVEVMDGIDRQLVTRILAGESVSVTHRFSFMQDIIMLAGVPIRDTAGALQGGLILAQPLSELNRLFRGTYMVVLLVVSGALLLAVLLAVEQTQVLVRPIQRITQAARRMAEGTYAERVSPLPANEIGDLGRALNSMSARLIDVISNLRKERFKLEWVISGIGEGLIAVDAQWNLAHVNDAFLQLTELKQQEDIRNDQSAEMARFRDMLDRCLLGSAGERLKWLTPSGRALQADASSIKDESGAILGTVCLVRDVSEAQRLEQLRRDYVANISHELRTPLTGIRGMVEPLIDGCMDTEAERQECYRVILKETVRLQKLVGEMLDMSRLQDGRLTVELEPMELPGILEAAARSMQAIADEAGVTLDVETDGSPLACMGNEDRITQVLVILLDNALSFTPSGGRVTVFARDAGDCVALGVRDTGCGIEPKDLPYIWERFYKADRSRMRTEGTGLGLAIAKLLTEMMGGGITAQSEPGKGAEFTFTLKKQT